MKFRWKSARAFMVIPLALLVSTLAAGVAQAASTKGAGGQMPAFFNGQQVMVNMTELPAGAEPNLIANNKSVNKIYALVDLGQEQPFPPVINAIQGSGFNPLWHQILINFNPGFTAHGFTSEADVLAAANPPNPEITLMVTAEVYRCAVVGSTGK